MRMLIIILILLLAVTSYAYDTDIGKVSLTKNQIEHLGEMNGVLGIKGVTYWHDDEKLIIVTDRPLSDSDKITLVDFAKSLPDVPTIKPKTIEARLSKLEQDVGELKP